MITGNLNELANQYVALNQALGYRFTTIATHLRNFLRFAQRTNEAFIRSETVLAWLDESSHSSPLNRTKKLRAVRNFARWLQVADQRHEVPPDLPFAYRYRRPMPHLLSVADIDKILVQALKMPQQRTIAPLTWHYLFGLIATTGIRIGEALALTLDDIVPDGIVIRDAKFGKTRLIAVHPSTSEALNRYLAYRCKVATEDQRLFVIATGNGPSRTYAIAVFRKLAEQAGLREPGVVRGPTPHSLRHSFAVRSLENLSTRADASRHMLALSTYLGHSKMEHTYWYLEATPILLHGIAQTTEAAHLVVRGGCHD